MCRSEYIRREQRYIIVSSERRTRVELRRSDFFVDKGKWFGDIERRESTSDENERSDDAGIRQAYDQTCPHSRKTPFSREGKPEPQWDTCSQEGVNKTFRNASRRAPPSDDGNTNLHNNRHCIAEGGKKGVLRENVLGG